jgi:hypothetical protein
VVNYNIGVDCVTIQPFDGCYIGSPSDAGGVSLSVATPNSTIMQTTRHYEGYGYAAASQQIKTLLQCVFDTTNCATYDQAACNAFQDKWDGGTGGHPNNLNFLTDANACTDGVSKRR